MLEKLKKLSEEQIDELWNAICEVKQVNINKLIEENKMLADELASYKSKEEDSEFDIFKILFGDKENE